MKTIFATLIAAVTYGTPTATADSPCHIVAFGDSNTAVRGPVNVYAKQLKGRLDNAQVTNAGIGGNQTGMALARLDRDVLGKKPDVVIIMFGINDAAVDVWKKPPATKPRVSLDLYESNLRRIVKQCRQTGATPILMTPTPLRWSEKTRQRYGAAPYKPDDIDGFNVLLPKYVDAVRRIAKTENVALCDTWKSFHEAKGGPESLLLSDGMHLNDAGHALVTDSVLPLIQMTRSNCQRE